MIHKCIMICILTALLLGQPLSVGADSFLDRLSNFFNIKLSSGQMKGAGDDVAEGSIWIAELDKKTTTQITQEGGYRSPVFISADSGILALRGNTIVQIKPGAPPENVRAVERIVKLVGFDGKNPDEILVLLNDETKPLGILSLKTGSIALLPYDPKSDDHKRVLSRIRGQGRIQRTTRVFVKKMSKQGLSHIIEWTDVFVKQGESEPQNISTCDGIDCSQPALSPDGRQVVFVKTED